MSQAGEVPLLGSGVFQVLPDATAAEYDEISAVTSKSACDMPGLTAARAKLRSRATTEKIASGP